MRDLPNLDFVRSCAVLSVIAEHVLLAYGIQHIGRVQMGWLGIVGVLLFFVHTSLVLMWSLERKPHTLDFYIRRVFRIYPLALLAVFLTIGLHAPLAGNPLKFFWYFPPPTWKSYVGIILLAPNVIGGYYPMSVMWSLPYEVEMYLVLPVLFFFIRENFSRILLLFLLLVEIGICRTLFPGAQHNFFLVVPYFVPGVIAHIGFRRDRPRFPAWMLAPALFLCWAIFLLHPGWRQGYGVCLAVGLGLPLFRQFNAAWIKRASHEIAKYSYGLYLAHPFSLALGVYLMPHQPVWLQLVVVFVSMAAFSVGAYHLLEKPMIRLGSRVAQKAETRFEQRQLATFAMSPTDIG